MDDRLPGSGSAFVVVPLLVLFTLPLCARAVRLGARFDVGGLMVAALLLRFLAVIHRYRYRQDAGVYHQVGSQLAEQFRNLQFGVDPGAPIPGTGGQRYVTGVVEVFTNNNEFATFLVFTWLAFLGCYLLYEAFVTALPEADHRRYALLVFLWPTLVFWPSSICKDGWMLFTLGLASLGAARVLARERGGYTLFLVGIAARELRATARLDARPGRVRRGVPASVGRAEPLVPGRSTAGGVAKVAGFVVLLAIGALLVDPARRLPRRARPHASTVRSRRTSTAPRRGLGAFEPADPQNPLGYARASVNILFRPFPFEAQGIEQLLTSLEALALLGLCVVSWRRLASVPFRLRRDPYVAYALSMVLMFIFVLGTIGNFGILARQRSQVDAVRVRAAVRRPCRRRSSKRERSTEGRMPRR